MLQIAVVLVLVVCIQVVGNGHGAVLAAGAADRHGKVILALLHIFGKGNGRAFSKEMEITYLGDLPIEERVSDSPNQEGVIATIDPNDVVSKRFVEIVKDIQKEFTEE